MAEVCDGEGAWQAGFSANAREEERALWTETMAKQPTGALIEPAMDRQK
jgi:hypothetical protein